MRSKAVLLPGVKVTLNIEGAKETESRTWSYPEGMKGYLAELLAEAQAVAPIFDGEKYVDRSERLRGRRRRGLGVRVRRGRARATASRTRT